MSKISPSETKALDQMLRSHDFLKHEELVLWDLREFSVDVKTADMLSRFLQKNIDIPDSILRMEEIAIERKYFTDFLAKYIAEEYSIQEHYSFCVVALLNYCKSKLVCLDDAITELIFLSSKQTICFKCCTEGETPKEKREIVNHHNHNILKSLDYDVSSDEDEGDLFSEDDSVNDPLYKGDEEADSSPDTTSSLDREMDRNVNKFRGYNPFDSSDEEEIVKNPTSVFNSSVSYNPFDEIKDNEHLSGGKKVNLCQYCSKSFSNSHNMKLHVIGFVIFKR